MRYTLTTLLPVVLCFSLASPCLGKIVGGRKLFKFYGRNQFASFHRTNVRWDSSSSAMVLRDGAREGSLESPDVETGFATQQFIVSWNAHTPPGTYVTINIQARSSGLWSRRFVVAIWSRHNDPLERMSVNGQQDDIAEMETETLKLKKPADAFRVSARLHSADGSSSPALRMLAVHALSVNAEVTNVSSWKPVWGKDLPVPERSQLTVPDGQRFCSATCTSMVLAYWSEKIGRPELCVPLQAAVDGIYDKEWGGTGNWSFNTAYAAEFGGLHAYVTRLAGVSQIEQWIARDVPVIASIDYNVLRNRPNGRAGHLVLVRGFTESGDPILNDPYAHLDRGESVRKVVPRADFERSWAGEQGSFGVVYLIYPEGWSVPRNRYSNW